MIPKLNQKIYVIYDETITKERVYMLGENEFAHSNSFNTTLCERVYR